MKTVIFVYAGINFKDNYPCSWIPFSILSIASVMPKNEYESIVFDGNRKDDNAFAELLLQKDVLAVAFSIMTGGDQIANTLDLALKVKQYNEKIVNIFGGPHVNVLPIQTLEHPLVDMVVVGPGQENFYELIKAINNEANLSNINGVHYKLNGKIYSCLPPKPLKSLYPYDFSLININDYIQYDSTISDRTINYIASQGCVYACNFCYECTYKKRYYKVPIEYIEKDLFFFTQKYNVNGIKFYDADFFIDKNAAIAVSNMLKEYGLKWAASAHPLDILRAEKDGHNILLKNIKDSNCRRLLMGIESGSNRILKEVINKRASKEDILFVAKRIAEYGILGSYTFMLGLPNETNEEQDETFEFIEKLWELSPKPETNVHIYIPYPGTPLYKEAISSGFIPPAKLEDWSSFNYYKAMTPWTSLELEKRVHKFSSLINKKKQ